MLLPAWFSLFVVCKSIRYYLNITLLIIVESYGFLRPRKDNERICKKQCEGNRRFRGNWIKFLVSLKICAKTIKLSQILVELKNTHVVELFKIEK